MLPPLTLPTLRNTASAPVPSPNSAASPSSAPNIAQHRVCTQPHPRHRAILRTTPPTPAPVVCSPCRPAASLHRLSAQPSRSTASARDCAPPALPSPTADRTPRSTAPTPAHAAYSPCQPSLHPPPVPRCRRRAAQRLYPTASPHRVPRAQLCPSTQRPSLAGDTLLHSVCTRPLTPLPRPVHTRVAPVNAPGEVDQVPPTGRGRGPGRRGAGTTYRQGDQARSRHHLQASGRGPGEDKVSPRQAGGPGEVKQVPPTGRGARRGTSTTYRQGDQARSRYRLQAGGPREVVPAPLPGSPACR